MELRELSEKISTNVEDILRAFMKEDKYALIDRVQTRGFMDVFRDSMYNYDMGHILVERVFKKDKCKTEKMEYMVPSDEDLAKVDELSKIFEELKTEGIEGFSERQKKIEELTERISHPVKVLKEFDVRIFQNGNFKYVLFDLNELSFSSTVKPVSRIYSDFALTASRFFNFPSINEKTDVDIITIETPDYTDILVKLK